MVFPVTCTPSQVPTLPRLPDGSYRMSQIQVAECVGKPQRNAGRFLEPKGIKALQGEGYTPDTMGDRNALLAQRLEQAEADLAAMGEAYAEPDLLRMEFDQLRQQVRDLGSEPWQLPGEPEEGE